MRFYLTSMILLSTLTTAFWASAQEVPKQGDVVFTQDFEAPDAYADWANVTEPATGYQSEHGITINNPVDGGHESLTRYYELPVDNMRGCLVHFSGMVKCENISEKPQSWNGVKFMVIIETPGGKTYPQGDIGVGTFDWKHILYPVRIPDDAISATLVLGLELVTGQVWYDDFKFTIRKPPFVVVPREADGPVYKGHNLPRLRGAMISPNIDAGSLRTFGIDWNANLIRWQLVGWQPKGTELDLEAYDLWLEDQLSKLNAKLPLCEELGIYVVVDLHNAPSGTAESGKGLFTDKSCQEKFVENWKMIAHRYKGSKAVWGYDLINEPMESAVAEDLMDWEELSEITAQAVRAIDPDHAIIIEPGMGANPPGLNQFKPSEVPGVVYSVHMYLPHAFTHQGVFSPDAPEYVYPGEIDGVMWDKAQLEAALKPAMDFQQTYKVHIYIGEFSAIRWAPDNSAYRYLRDLIDIFEANDWDWSYHAFREWTGWSVEHANDKADEAPTATPNDRQNLLRDWLSFNEKPQW